MVILRFVDIREELTAMRISDNRVPAPACTCKCHACDGGHHCGNPPNCTK